MKQRRHGHRRSHYKKQRVGSNDNRSNTPAVSADKSTVASYDELDLTVLPSASLLQEYEYATDGAADRILDMAREEQQRRLAWEDRHFHSYQRTIRCGQFFGFCAFTAVLIETHNLISIGREDLALIIFMGAMITGLLSALLFSSVSSGPDRPKSRRIRKESKDSGNFNKNTRKRRSRSSRNRRHQSKQTNA